MKRKIFLIAIIFLLLGSISWLWWWFGAYSFVLNPFSYTLKEHATPFYSFSYPNDYKISSEHAYTEHETTRNGNDIYGLSYVQLVKGNYTIELRSSPNWHNLDPQEILSDLGKEFLTFQDESSPIKDSFERLVIDGNKAVRIFRPSYDKGNEFRFGSQDVIVPKVDRVYVIAMTWISPQGNYSFLKEQRGFRALVDSFRIVQD